MANISPLSGYAVILAHFEHVSQARLGQCTPAVKGRATFMVKKLQVLQKLQVLHFIYFIQDLLCSISILSLKFHCDEGPCIDFIDALEATNLALIELGQQLGEQLQAFQDALVHAENGQCQFKNTTLTHHDANAGYEDLQAVVKSVIDRFNGRLEHPNDPVRPILQYAHVFNIKDWPHSREQLASC